VAKRGPGTAAIENDQTRPDRLNSLQSLFLVADMINGSACWRQNDIESLFESALRCQRETLVDFTFPLITPFGDRPLFIV